ncbi:MAG: tetratricopeptide repeat protein [Myxococcales bacterium]|nr:tetratricopeptide repeat protein [Myxococcales bacterium]
MIQQLARKHFERGRQFELQERIPEAIEAYRRACDMQATFPEPYLALARIEATRGRHEEALALLDTAAGFGDDPQVIEWRAYVNGRLRRFEDALADYRQVVDGGDPHVRVNLGRMLLALGRYDEAAAELKKVEEDESAKQLLDALPRYREFGADRRVDDLRTVRYLFGGTVVLGTLGDGGLRLVGSRYLLLTPRHAASTIGRFVALVRRRKWTFDGVVGQGAHHGPVADAVARILGVPRLPTPEAGARVLLCSAVVKGPVEAASLSRPWREAGARVMHLALGLVPTGDPTPKEPDLVGFVNRCAVPWYRVEPYARLERDPDAPQDGDWPGFSVGPAFVDPNGARVAQELVEAYAARGADGQAEGILGWYRQHPQVRAFRWGQEDEG